jgi:molybdenum cofactor guanylyltransferase
VKNSDVGAIMENINNKEFTGYVLAGGKSRRMGEDKAFLEFGGKTFVEHAVSSLSTICENVKIVLNDAEIEPIIHSILPNVPRIFDIFKNRGALGGIHVALTDCESEFAIILACDLPLVDSRVIEKLAEIAVNTDENVAVIVPKQKDGRLQPLCAIYRKSVCLAKLEELFEKNESVSARDLIFGVENRIVSFEELSESEDIFTNVNEREDFEIVKNTI